MQLKLYHAIDIQLYICRHCLMTPWTFSFSTLLSLCINHIISLIDSHLEVGDEGGLGQGDEERDLAILVRIVGQLAAYVGGGEPVGEVRADVKFVDLRGGGHLQNNKSRDLLWHELHV